MTQFADQIRIRLISQSIKRISIVLQKLRKYFNEISIFTFIVSALLVLFKDLDLNLNDSESVIEVSGSSLQNWYKLLDYFE